MAAVAKVTPIKPTAFAIETGMPVPPGAVRNTATYDAIRALAEAPIGASFLCPSAKPTTAQQAAYRLGGKGWVAIRKVDGGFRVWKIAEPQTRA